VSFAGSLNWNLTFGGIGSGTKGPPTFTPVTSSKGITSFKDGVTAVNTRDNTTEKGLRLERVKK
jgi:hypothetical protein